MGAEPSRLRTHDIRRSVPCDNKIMDEGKDTAIAANGENYKRPAEVTATYDPATLFRVKQNIKPVA